MAIGGILARNTDSTVTQTGPGTTDHSLVSNGTGAVPTFKELPTAGIANDAVTNAKLANMAAGTYKMRVTASTGDPEDGTATQATAGLNVMVGDSGAGGTKGLVTAPAAGDAAAAKFLKADATWAVPAGAGAGTVTNTGTLTANRIIKGNGGVDITVGDLTGDITTSGTMATTAKAALKHTGLGITIDGGGSAITTGIKGDLYVPFTCTITAVTMLADQSGSIVVDVWKDSYANYPPVDGDSITASAVPTITTATKSQDTTLTGWTTSITAGDTLRFNVDSATTATRVILTLTVSR